MCKHNKQGKLASFTANILPSTSFSAQVTDAKQIGLVTSKKSERKNELNRQVNISNTALSRLLWHVQVLLAAKDLNRDSGKLFNSITVQLASMKEMAFLSSLKIQITVFIKHNPFWISYDNTNLRPSNSCSFMTVFNRMPRFT